MRRTTKDRDGKGTGRPEGGTRVTHGLWQRPEAELAKRLPDPDGEHVGLCCSDYRMLQLVHGLK